MPKKLPPIPPKNQLQDKKNPNACRGRAGFQIENETFNTLKTQGYYLEHNYGHDKPHLATVLARLMRLDFLIDQVQELAGPLRPHTADSTHARNFGERYEVDLPNIYSRVGKFSGNLLSIK